MQRTQVYLASDQATRLDERARAAGTTRSALIRDAIERYLDGDTRDARLGHFRSALAGAFGVASYLAADYVSELRANDRARQVETEERWRRDRPA